MIKKLSKNLKAEMLSNQMDQDEEEDVIPAIVKTDEEKAEERAAKKKANRKNTQWKKQGLSVTGKNGPRNVSGH